MDLHELHVDTGAYLSLELYDSSAVLGSARYSFERLYRNTRHCKLYSYTREYC